MHSRLARELDLGLYTLDSVSTSALYISEINYIVEDTLKALPEQTQEIFRLSRKDDLSNREIAQRMHLSEKSIEFHITKALKKLRMELADYLKIIVMMGITMT